MKKAGGAYWLYGAHAVQAALGNPKRRFEQLLVAKEEAVPAVPQGVRVQTVSLKELNDILPKDAVHQGIALLTQPLPAVTLESVLQGEPAPVVVLDQVTDPHNVGAILRSCAAFGAKAVVMTDMHAPQESAVMAKAASGGLECVPLVRVVNLAQALEKLKKADYWTAGLDGEATQALHEAKLGRNTALVLGAEGKGLRRLTAERCDLLVKLPISPLMESLNVSNAAAVALYELGRSAMG